VRSGRDRISVSVSAIVSIGCSAPGYSKYTRTWSTVVADSACSFSTAGTTRADWPLDPMSSAIGRSVGM
jgi:hypothetical protein